MLRSRDYRQKIAFKKTIEDALVFDYTSIPSGLFAKMNLLTDLPDFLTEISYEQLDPMFLQYAPEKWISKPCADVFYRINVNDELEHIDGMSTIAAQLVALYGNNWNNIWQAYTTRYAPLENYDMTEKTTYNSSHEHSGTDTLTKSGSETDTKSGTETNTKSGTETTTQGGSETNVRSGSEELAKAGSEATLYNSETENQVSAFNSSAYQDATKAIHSGADGISYGVTASEVSDPRTDTTTYNDVTDEKTFTNRTDELSFSNRKDELSFTNRQDTLTFTNREDETEYDSEMKHTGYDELERHGNIGVTTSQQMLQSEIDLRQYNFIMQVFRDITDYLGLPIY